MRRLRHALGGAARPLASLEFWQDDDSWLMFSGIDNVDYNVAMLSGPNGPRRAEQVLQAASRHGLPAMVFLPPGAEHVEPVLSAGGWSHVRDVPFMRQRPRRRPADPNIRELTVTDFPAARECVMDAFAGPESLGRALFNETVFARSDTSSWGIFLNGEMVGCGLLTAGPEALCAWGMGVRRSARRTRAALSLVHFGVDLAARGDPPRPFLFNATEDGERLHRALGGEVLERWQSWTCRRWVLGRSTAVC
ncbi:hypothetical protein [Flexivirga sp.]|uniref:hypothetical protein n=1 Tax=Flexivirga sp. TaxID=1962927 RepID=UPI003F80CF8F